MLLVECDLGNGDNYNQSGVDLPNNEVVLVMKDFLKDVGIDANIKTTKFPDDDKEYRFKIFDTAGEKELALSIAPIVKVEEET